MCANCRAFITTSDATCPYCGEKTGPRAIDRRQTADLFGGIIPHAHFTTILILIINFGLFLATWQLSKTQGDGAVLEEFGAKWGPAIFYGHQWWRLVTAGFLHGGWLHILMNSWVLYDLGAQVEQVFGTPRFLVVYFAGTVGGFYLSALLNPNIPSVGSSAGIMGLIGAMIAFGVANRSSVGRAIRNFYSRWVVYILVLGFIPGFNTDKLGPHRRTRCRLRGRLAGRNSGTHHSREGGPVARPGGRLRPSHRCQFRPHVPELPDSRPGRACKEGRAALQSCKMSFMRFLAASLC